jgi:parallel beta-helix repeat protein
MFSKKSFITLSTVFIVTISGTAGALEYSSYIFTVKDIIFFSYENGTQVQVYDSTGQLLWPDGPDVFLAKGQHAIAQFNNTNQVYKVCGSKKFAVLTGDPAREGRGVSGYYTMDANGLGTCKELYTYVPVFYNSDLLGHQFFIVFAYQDNTHVTVQRDTGNGNYQYFDSFTLDKGKHWANSGLYNEYLQIIADKPVSALTCHDQSYFVPSASGRWSGTEFYTYLSGIVGWPIDLTVIAYDNDTSVMIKDTNDPNVIWSGTLNSGKAHVESYPYGVEKYFTVTSSKPVTVSAQIWKAKTTSGYQEVFIPDRMGTGVGTDLIGSSLDGDLAYLYILAHKDNTHVDLYDANNRAWQASYTLNMGQAVNANPGNGLWRIVSDKDISAYSGGGDYGIYAFAAEFAPLAFNTFPLSLEKVDINEPNSVIPGEHITYTIDYANPVTNPELTDVNIVDELPEEVDYISSDPCGIYNPYTRMVTWNIGTLSPGEPGSVTLTVKVNLLAEPLRTITNRAIMTTSIGRIMATEITDVNSWKPPVIYVDADATGSNTGMSWDSAYRDLQDALARARAGCGSEIWVAAGTYRPSERIDPGDPYTATFLLVDGVAIYGGFAGNETTSNQRNWLTNQTILDGNLGEYAVSYVVIAQNVNEATILDGFTIMRGGQSGVGCAPNSSPTIAHNTIIENNLDGIYCYGASPIIIHNTIKQNYRGLTCESNSSPDIKACLIQGNAAGGIDCRNSALIVADCIIEDSNYGCGIYCESSSSVNLKNSVIRFNGNYGIYLKDTASATIKNNWIHNSGYGGILFNNQISIPIVRNNTIYDNFTYGIESSEYGADPNIVNCIIYANDSNDFYRPNGTFQKVNYCCLQHAHPGNGNITGDPCFMNPDDPNDLHIDANSPCIDKGDPNGNYDGETDIDGQPRVMVTQVDIGADEAAYMLTCDPNYDKWVSVGEPDCWCYQRQCYGDADGKYETTKSGKYYVHFNDLNLLLANWNVKGTTMSKPGICADFARDYETTKTGIYRVHFNDLNILLANWNVKEPPDGNGIPPDCLKCQRGLAEQQIKKVKPLLKPEQMIKWLEELWLDEETQKVIDKDIWLKFIESLKEELYKGR